MARDHYIRFQGPKDHDQGSQRPNPLRRIHDQAFQVLAYPVRSTMCIGSLVNGSPEVSIIQEAPELTHHLPVETVIIFVCSLVNEIEVAPG